MRKIKILIFCIIGLVIAACILGTIPWEVGVLKNAAFSYLGKKFQKEISADSLRVSFLNKLEVTNLKITDRKGFTFSAQKLKFDYNLPKLFSGGLVAKCEAKDVRVLRKNSTFLKPVFELLLLSYPLGSLRFQNVYTNIYLENKTFIPKNLEAVGRNIKVYGDGSVSPDKVVDYKLKFLIAPKGLSSTLSAEGGWISLSFRIKGKKDKLLVIPLRD